MSIFSETDARASGWGKRSAAFALWMNTLNKLVYIKTGLSVHDFPDWDFASAFDEGLTPHEARRDFIEAMQADGYL